MFLLLLVLYAAVGTGIFNIFNAKRTRGRPPVHEKPEIIQAGKSAAVSALFIDAHQDDAIQTSHRRPNCLPFTQTLFTLRRLWLSARRVATAAGVPAHPGCSSLSSGHEQGQEKQGAGRGWNECGSGGSLHVGGPTLLLRPAGPPATHLSSPLRFDWSRQQSRTYTGKGFSRTVVEWFVSVVEGGWS